MQHTLEKSTHQRVESLLRHRAVIATAVLVLFGALIVSDRRLNNLWQQAYSQGFNWVGAYMHHEHPRHDVSHVAIARIPTISGNY
jgi:hypothetical protein